MYIFPAFSPKIDILNVKYLTFFQLAKKIFFELEKKSNQTIYDHYKSTRNPFFTNKKLGIPLKMQNSCKLKLVIFTKRY